MKRGEVWWADLGPYRPREQTGRRPVIIWQSDSLMRVLQSLLGGHVFGHQTLVVLSPLTCGRASDRRDNAELGDRLERSVFCSWTKLDIELFTEIVFQDKYLNSVRTLRMV